MAKKKVLWWGRFDPGYSRNRVHISLFAKLGWEVDFVFVKLWPRFGDVEAFFRGLQFREKPDLVWAPVARQRDDWSNRESYFTAARDFFERHLSMDVIERQLADILDDVCPPGKRP